MLLQVFSIYDSKMESFNPPLFYPNKGVAIRALTDFLNSSKDNAFVLHPDDYRLYHFGDFDDDSGRFDLFSDPSPILYLSDLLPPPVVTS